MTDAAHSDEPSAAEYVALRIARLPGVTNVEAQAGDGHGIDIRFDGWSPTLHAARVSLPAPTSPAALGIPDALRAAVNAQAERGRDALRLDIEAPLPHAVDPVGDAPVAISHLCMDRSVVALLREAGVDPVARAREAVSAIHGALATHDGGTGIHYPAANAAIAEASDPEHPDRPHRLVLVEATANHGRVATNGITVTVDLPAFKAMLATGFRNRPLRDLIEIHPALDDRIVVGCDANGSGRETILHLRPDPVPISTLLDVQAG